MSKKPYPSRSRRITGPCRPPERLGPSEYRVDAEPDSTDQRTQDSLVISYGYGSEQGIGTGRMCSLRIGNRVAVLDGPARMALVVLLAAVNTGDADA